MHQVFRITLDDALPMLQAARAKAEELGVKQTICVCDDGGNVLAPAPAAGRPADRRRDLDRQGVHVGRSRAGHPPVQRAAERPGAARATRRSGSRTCCPGKFAIFVGGFPIVHEGQIVGAVGVSGGNGEQDKAVGAAALQAFADHVAANPPA